MNCKRCGLEFKDRRNLVQHLKRKTPCMAIESEVSLLEQLEELQERKGIMCENCERIYKNKESVRKHNCRIIKYDKLEIARLKSELELEKNKNKCNKIKNINNGTINNVNININSFGNENISYITENVMKTLTSMINGGSTGVINLIKSIHINEKYPENHNIKIENMKKGILKIYEGNKWHFYTFEGGLDKLYNKTEVKFQEMLEEVDESELLEVLNSNRISMFNNNVGAPLGWDRILEEDVEEVDERIIIVKSKEEIEKEKLEEKRKRRNKKNIDNLVIQEIKNV